MHAFVVGSTFVISYMIFASCRRRCFGDVEEEDEINMDYIHQKYPFSHYISKAELLQFFSLDSNLFRLKRVLDLSNGILDKTIKLVETNQKIQEDFENTLLHYGPKYFHINYNYPTVFEIRDTKFKTSLGQLNFIRWLILNDYFLHIE